MNWLPGIAEFPAQIAQACMQHLLLSSSGPTRWLGLAVSLVVLTGASMLWEEGAGAESPGLEAGPRSAPLFQL